MIRFGEHIFQMGGLNHQLEQHFKGEQFVWSRFLHVLFTENLSFSWDNFQYHSWEVT